MSVRFFLSETLKESFAYDPAEVERLWEAIGPSVPDYLLRGDEETNHESRVIAVFSAMEGSLASPFTSREDYGATCVLTSEDDSAVRVRTLERAAAPPQGSLVGIVDEYGSVWAGEPAASARIGDLVTRPDDETSWLYLEAAQS